MWPIEKGQEPSYLEDLRDTPGANWSSVGAEQKQHMRESAFREQGGLCAYCMSKLSGTVRPDDQGLRSGGMKIEHFIPRHGTYGDPAKLFDWQNLLGVCPGDAGGPRRPKAARFHCDTYRADALLGVNPARSPDVSTFFRYSSAGEILAEKSTPVREVAAQTNIDALNLNHSRLKANRKAVIDRTRRLLQKRGFKRSAIERYLHLATSRDQDARLQEFCGAIAYYLTKKLRTCA